MHLCVISYLDKIGYPNKNPGAFTDHTTYFTTKIDHTYTLQRSIDKQNQDQSHSKGKYDFILFFKKNTMFTVEFEIQKQNREKRKMMPIKLI